MTEANISELITMLGAIAFCAIIMGAVAFTIWTDKDKR